MFLCIIPLQFGKLCSNPLKHVTQGGLNKQQLQPFPLNWLFEYAGP